MRHALMIRAAAALLALMLPTSTLAAQSVADCYEKVTALCADAMEDANFVERVAIGIFCTGMLAGCNTTIVLQK